MYSIPNAIDVFIKKLNLFNAIVNDRIQQSDMLL